MLKKELELQEFDEYFRKDIGYFGSPSGCSALCWGTLLMTKENSIPLLQTECTQDTSTSRSISYQR